MKQYVLQSLDDELAVLDWVGGKGASLARLTRAGLPVPPGFYITIAAYRRFVSENELQPHILAALSGVNPTQPKSLQALSENIRQMFTSAVIPDELANEIIEAYRRLPGKDPAVAVRSSATAEDLPESSFAGQQDTYLNIYGTTRLLEAVKKCWSSLWTARAISYRAQRDIPPESVALAVVVQELVNAEAAGILFTANPVNGNRNEALINASWGLGEAVVSGQVTPDTLVVDKASGKLLRCDTGDKRVMTVRIEDGTQEQATPDALRMAEVLNSAQAAQLVRIGDQVEQLYALPMDIEWARDRDQFYVLQARPITALPEPSAPTTIEWKMPNPKAQYMRGSIVDLLPDPVSPLFATLAIPSIRHVGTKEVLRILTRSEPLLPDDYITIINEYAYMGISYNTRQWWWMITRMVFSFPRLLRMGIPLWRDRIRPQYLEVIARWKNQPIESMSPQELWAEVQQVNDAAMLHLASLLVATTGASAGAEGLFTRIYEKMIRRENDPTAVTFLMGYNSTPIQADKALYDLACWCKEHGEVAAYLLETPTERLAAELAEGTAPVAGWTDFCERLHEHQKTYGHIIYDLDYAKQLPLDDPSPKLETIRMYLRNQGINPHARQGAAEEKRLQAVERILSRVKGLRRWSFLKTLGMAQTMAQVRENALSDIGLGYPLLRKLLRALGAHFARAGWIEQEEDIFWLESSQVEQAVAALESGASQAHLSECVAQRKAAHQALKRFTPPPMLPPRKKYLGFDMEAFTPAAEDSHSGSTLKGVAASAGRVTGLARVLFTPEDFNQMKPGEVLVAATTTPAWTPLFAMASAIVTDIGGPLSHGSIVAREYGIPAVLGTGVATRRIQSGQMLRVDGNAGTVEILQPAQG